MLRIILEQHGSEGVCFRGEQSFPGSENGISHARARNNASWQDSQPTVLTSHHGNRGAQLAAKADLVLAPYPAYVREQVTDLLRAPINAGDPNSKLFSQRTFDLTND